MAAGVLAKVLESYNDIGREEDLVLEAPPSQVEIAGLDGEVASADAPVNWLLVATDSREGIDPDDPDAEFFLADGEIGGRRTDTMLIARVDPTLRTVELLSLPRDLYVPIAGTGTSSRINTAFNADNGAQRLVDTIQNEFGIPIHRYAEVNFVGFRDVVDELGGVPIWFDQPMRDTGSGLDIGSAGCHFLDGSQALAFARGRNVEYFSNGSWRLDGSGDLGRTSRQQYFLGRVAARATSQLDVTSIDTVLGILEVGGQNLTLDGATSAQDLFDLAQIFSSLEDGQIRGHALPVFQFRAPNNAAVLGLVEDEAQPTLDIFRGVQPVVAADGSSTPTTIPTAYTVLVQNGSGTPGQAKEVGTELGTLGFEVSSFDNAPERPERTTIAYGVGMEATATRLARQLAIEPLFEFDESLTEVVFTTGPDFVSLLDEPKAEGEVAAPTTTAPPTTAAPETTAAPTTASTEVIGVVPGATPEGTACG